MCRNDMVFDIVLPETTNLIHRRSLYRSQVFIEPLQDFLHHQVVGRDMAGFEDDVAFFFLRGPQSSD